MSRMLAPSSLKHGTDLRRRRLVIGDLPRQLHGARREGRGYRRALEATVLHQLGEITTEAAHAIDLASSACIHAAICRWLLRTRLSEMTVADALACSKEIVRAKESRNAAVRTLGLDKPKDMKSILDQIWNGTPQQAYPCVPTPQPDPQADPPAEAQVAGECGDPPGPEGDTRVSVSPPAQTPPSPL